MTHHFDSSMTQIDLLRSITNSALCQHLRTFQMTLQDDVPSQAFKALIDVMTQALLEGEKPADLALRIAKVKHRKYPSLNPLSINEATAILANIKKLRMLAKEHNNIRGSRKLDKYRQELAALHRAKASQRDMQVWLKREKRLKVSQTTIRRYLSEMKSHGEIE
jgi:hypothetical protein